MTAPIQISSVYADLGVRPVINACGIYSDLGGSCLSEEVWSALREVNSEWASIPELLEASGRRIAELVGAQGARVAPGAAACIALGTAACIAGNDGELNEQLPDVDLRRRTVILQSRHRYKYARCALLAGAQLEEPDLSSAADLEKALTDEVAAILHPAHLDAVEGTLPLSEVVEVARSHAVPVLVDAAYLSYPTAELRRWAQSGADLVCFSAKYFYGPNSSGFLAGRKDLIDSVGGLDFTHFEAGPYLNFGRPFKLDRTTIVATVLALEAWLERDHDARWRDYERRVSELVEAIAAQAPDLHPQAKQFTLDERLIESPVNALVVEPQGDAAAEKIEAQLAVGDPRIFCVPMGRQLVFCVETVRPEQDQDLVRAILAAANGGSR